MLANRYASAAMREVWTAESKIIAERRLWLAVLAAQHDLGVDFGGDDPAAVIAAYEAVVDQVDLASIADREKITRHDVKARIEEFNALAGFEHVHKGMTSRDLTENVEQLQIVSSLKIIRDRMVATLAQLAELADRVRRPADRGAVAQRGRPGHHAGQALRHRGRGAAGRLRADRRAARPLSAARHQGTGRHRPGHARPGRRRPGPSWPALEQRVADHLGFARVFVSTGQVYPRSLDYDVVTALAQVAAAPVQPGDQHPADGRARAGDRGIPARPGRLQRHAAQDEHPLLRAGQRARGDPPRLRLDGRRAGRRPVERGRRVLLGGPPGRPAGRVLRPRRAVRDVPQRARRTSAPSRR